MGTIFSDALVRLRKESGFSTAYKFFYGNGGKSGLDLTYRQYLLIEQGKNLPVFNRLVKLLYALRIVHKTAGANGLTTAWLRTMAGEAAFRDVLEPLLGQKAAAVQPPMHGAMEKSLATKKHYITPGEMDIIADNCENYLCYFVLSKDSGKWTPQALAKQLDIKEETAEKAMKALASAKVLRRDRKGLYFCPTSMAMREFPQMNLHPEPFKKIRAYQKRFVESGVIVFALRGFIRADLDALHNFFPLMRLNLSSAEAYNITEKTPRSAVFSVEGKITKLMDF